MVDIKVTQLKDIRLKDSREVGLKSAYLGEIYSRTAVPPGFVLPKDFFESFLIKTYLDSKINNIFAEINPHKPEQMQMFANDIQKKIVVTDMPRNLKEEILDYYHSIYAPDGRLDNLSKDASRPFVAVRNSPTVMPSSSRDHMTFLNIKGDDRLIKAVQTCWASLFTAKSIYHKFSNKIKEASIAVIVQCMLAPSVSGRASTVSKKSRKEITIEACYGLGEAISSGIVLPDIYTVDKNSFKTLMYDIKDQPVKLVCDTDAARTAKREVSPTERKEQKLGDNLIKEIAEEAVKLEKYFGFPLRIEFAVQNNNVYILQSDPVPEKDLPPHTADELIEESEKEAVDIEDVDAHEEEGGIDEDDEEKTTADMEKTEVYEAVEETQQASENAEKNIGEDGDETEEKEEISKEKTSSFEENGKDGEKNDTDEKPENYEMPEEQLDELEKEDWQKQQEDDKKEALEERPLFEERPLNENIKSRDDDKEYVDDVEEIQEKLRQELTETEQQHDGGKNSDEVAFDTEYLEELYKEEQPVEIVQSEENTGDDWLLENSDSEKIKEDIPKEDEEYGTKNNEHQESKRNFITNADDYLTEEELNILNNLSLSGPENYAEKEELVDDLGSRKKEADTDFLFADDEKDKVDNEEHEANHERYGADNEKHKVNHERYGADNEKHEADDYLEEYAEHNKKTKKSEDGKQEKPKGRTNSFSDVEYDMDSYIDKIGNGYDDFHENEKTED